MGDGAGPTKTMNYLRHTSVPYRPLLVVLATPLLLSLSGCVEFNRFLARPESKPANEKVQPNPQVAQEQAPEPIPKPQEKPKPGKLYEWSGDGRRVSRIVVNTDEQKARFYDGDQQIGWTTVASGIKKFPTPSGQFEVMEKVQNKRSNLYGRIYSSGGKVVHRDAKVGRDQIPTGARFEGASMPYFMRLTNDGVGLHAGPIPRPGRPASHGCIRMPKKFASVAYKHVDVGTKVTIVGSGPNYGNYVQKQREFAARERERREAAAREQAVAAATSGTATPQARPTSLPVVKATSPAGASRTAHSETRTAPVAATATTTAPTHTEVASQPADSAPATAGLPPAPAAAADESNQAPESVTGSPETSPNPNQVPIAQSAAPTQNPPPSPPPAAAPMGTRPVPGYPVPMSPMPPPAYFARPMQPAMARVPGPIAAPAPATVPNPAPQPPEMPAAAQEASPNAVPPTTAPPETPSAVSADEPKAKAEANEG